MPELTIISLSIWNLANAIDLDAKSITSVVVGAIGTAAALMRNLSEIIEDRSKIATEKVETARVAAVLDLLAKLPAGDAFSACRKELELQLAHTLRKLDALRERALKRAQSPNRDLTLFQRLFVFFPPVSRRICVLQGLTYVFLAGGPLTVLMLVLFRIVNSATVGDIVILIVFGSLAFRTWALAERKWAMQSGKPADVQVERSQAEVAPLATLFALRQSVGWKMLAAQVCMWACMFCAVESLEDIFLAGLDAREAATHTDRAEADMEKAKLSNRGIQQAQAGLRKARVEENTARRNARGGVLLLLIALFGVGICRAWACSELLRRSASTPIALAKAILPAWKPTTVKAWLLTAGYVTSIALLIVSLLSWPWIFDDLIDRIEFTFVWVAACVAFNRLLSSRALTTDSFREEDSSADWSPSVAA
ncbi:MAG TPA: hypothetical protein VNW97_13190 [Candidatus Saccharimonadales bacterium]|jgi:hypothetical protein|nr:hypothetical protein [Candidatus Saccharimonadales bacterium]